MDYGVVGRWSDRVRTKGNLSLSDAQAQAKEWVKDGAEVTIEQGEEIVERLGQDTAKLYRVAGKWSDRNDAKGNLSLSEAKALAQDWAKDGAIATITKGDKMVERVVSPMDRDRYEELKSVYGNPGEVPLHQLLGELADFVEYEAQVVEETAEEIDDEEIAEAAEEQAEAMHDAADALGDAAEEAADTAAKVFVETNVPSSDQAPTTSEGTAVVGNPVEANPVIEPGFIPPPPPASPPPPDTPPEETHWYLRKWGRR